MNQSTYDVEILTPCFCAGADQARAEIRVPSIRGQLRWWFRVLGASAAQEKAVFGGVHALAGERRDEAARSSAVAIRVSKFKAGVPWQPFRIDPNDSQAYIWYFASASADKKRWWNKPPTRGGGQPVPNPDGNVPAGSSFQLHVLFRRPVEPALEALLRDAIEGMLRFGCLGLRSSRGLGALCCFQLAGGREDYEQAARRLLEARGFAVRWMDSRPDWRSCLAYAGDVLKNQLRANCKVTQNRLSPLGNAAPRHASAVHLRPVRVAVGEWRLLLFEAPHDRVLPQQARRPKPLLAAMS